MPSPTSLWLAEAVAVFVKDWRCELRTRYALNTLGLFSFTTLVMVSVGLGPLGSMGLTVLPVILWVILLFSVSAGLPRAFVQRLRKVSQHSVVYAELPGAQHAFDVFPSIRSAHVVRGVDRFLRCRRCVGAVLDARFAPPGPESPGASVMLVFNATAEDVSFTLPVVAGHIGEWALRIYTAEGWFDEARARRYGAPAKLELVSHSMALLTQAPQE